MKRIIYSSLGSYNYQYEVHWVSPEGKDYLLGKSKSLEKAEKIALDQIDQVYESPFESPERKVIFIEQTYIYDAFNDKDVTTYAVEDTQDSLLGMLL